MLNVFTALSLRLHNLIMTFHEFNPFSGRLKESTRFQPLYPLNPSTLQRSDPPKMIWDTIKTKPAAVAKLNNAGYSSSVDPKVLAKMQHFGKDIYKPIFLMGGTKDKILFGLTATILSINLVLAGQFIYEAMKKF